MKSRGIILTTELMLLILAVVVAGMLIGIYYASIYTKQMEAQHPDIKILGIKAWLLNNAGGQEIQISITVENTGNSNLTITSAGIIAPDGSNYGASGFSGVTLIPGEIDIISFEVSISNGNLNAGQSVFVYVKDNNYMLGKPAVLSYPSFYY